MDVHVIKKVVNAVWLGSRHRKKLSSQAAARNSPMWLCFHDPTGLTCSLELECREAYLSLL